MAERVRGCLRPADTAARLGGDEFAVLLEDLPDAAAAARVAGRVFAALGEPFVLRDGVVFVRASAGIAVSPSKKETADELLRDADAAMYAAKGWGKGRYELFEPNMRAAALGRMELKADLRRAVDEEQFVVHYQPIIVLQSGQIGEVEALVRWRHPERGLIPRWTSSPSRRRRA